MDFIRQDDNCLTALLIDYFRRHYSMHYNANIHKIVIKYIINSYGNKIFLVEKEIYDLGINMLENISLLNIRSFVKKTLKLIEDNGFNKNSLIKAEINIKKLAKENIKTALRQGMNEHEAILYSSKKLLAIKKNNERLKAKGEIIKNHPLKESLLSLNQIKVAKEDIRNHLLYLNNNLKKSSTLYLLLTKARSFNIFHLHNLLGDELFYLLKPLGFLDKNDNILQAEVATSSHQAIAHFRKIEVLRALKKDEVFKNVKDIKFISSNL